MSARSQHVQDSTVVERRLRPIYEWLDSGNNKKALQESDKVLKKTPNLQCAKALKALALLRMGKENDCMQILDILTSEKPCDDSTLQAMAICYRELQQMEKICSLYETAVKIDQANEELLTHLFMSYVRVSDFKSQQQAAMQLYKLKPKNPYYCWAVMSIVLQATRGPGATDPAKRKVLLTLAERMFDKMLNENRLEAEQEVQLYLMVLELQGKDVEALAVLDGPLGSRIVSSNMPQQRMTYLVKLKQWSDVNLLCKSILSENMDRWDIWKVYVESVFELMDLSGSQINNHNNEIHDNGENDLEIVDDTPEKAHEFICRLVENGNDNGYLLRGPYLARFELCSCLNQRNIDSADLLGEASELFIEYFRKFGHKPCCVSDLRIYLNLLEVDKRADLSARLLKDVGISATTLPQSEQQMQRHICSLQLSRLCGGHRNLSSDHLGALVTALSLHYQHGAQTYCVNLLPTDQGSADAYALLAAHVLYDLSLAGKSSGPLILALVLLDSLLKASPNNFHAKLLCVRLYHTLGAGLGAQQMYNSLDIKHLQLDSMGYIHCARLPSTGLISLTMQLIDTTVKFFTSNYKDSTDHLTFSYKFGSFLKLNEFMDFRERLNNSLHYTTSAIDRIFMEIIQCKSVEALGNLEMAPDDDKINWSKLRDNHDLSVYLSWDPERTSGPVESDPEIKTLFEQDCDFLKCRVPILWSMSTCVQILKCSNENANSRVKLLGDLEKILKEWEENVQRIKQKNYVDSLQNQISLPMPSRIHSQLATPYVEILGKLFKFIHIFANENGQENNRNEIANEVKTTFTKMVDDFRNLICKQNNVDDCLWERRKTLELVVNSVEVACVSTIVCAICHELIKPAAQSGKKNKKKSSVADSKLLQLLSELASMLTEQMSTMDSILESWKCPFSPMDLSEWLGALSIANDQQKYVIDNLRTSHFTAVKELRAVLKTKVQLVSVYM